MVTRHTGRSGPACLVQSPDNPGIGLLYLSEIMKYILFPSMESV